jgi:16S rRNA (uracil1498-N3)-methyltransferase
VRRIGVGERVDVGDGDGRVARCTVRAVGRDRLDLEVLTVQAVPLPAPRLVLVQALAKGGRDELAVEAATELGVDGVVPWQAARSVVQWRGERGERSRLRWEATARAAAKQARRARVPVVEQALDSPGLAGRLAGTVALVLHEAASGHLADASLPAAGAATDVVVVVGPEGGMDEAEVALLTAAGGRAVRLGPHVLRSSTAGPAALAVLADRLGRWT